MGLTSISSLGSCGHAQQPQYLGESPYNLADVDFNTDVVKFYSKVPTDGYFKEENICRELETERWSYMTIISFTPSLQIKWLYSRTSFSRKSKC